MAPHGLASPGPHKAGKAQYLAAAKLERDIFAAPVFAREVAAFEDNLAKLEVLFRRVLVGTLYFAAHHQTYHVVGGKVCHLVCAHIAAVLHNGDTVAYLGYFRQLVRDEHNALALAAKLADNGEQALYLFLRQAGGWLIHHNNPGVEGHGLGYFYHLLFTDAQLAHRGGGLSVAKVHLFQKLFGSLVHFSVIYHRKRADLFSWEGAP